MENDEEELPFKWKGHVFLVVWITDEPDSWREKESRDWLLNESSWKI